MPPPNKKVTNTMVTHNPESTTMTSVSEWEQRTTWARVLDGADVPEGNEFHRCDEQADTFNGAERWTNEAYDGDTNAAMLIASDTHLELAADCDEPPVWWPDSEAVPVDKLTAYAGVREISRAEAARKLDLDETSVIESLGWVFSYPGMDKVSAAANARGVNPWGVLGAVMAWVAVDIPPEVTTLSEQWGQGTFNLFVALCGEPGAGKGITARLGSELVRRGAQGNFVTDSYNTPVRGMVGSPEGMISALLPRTPAEDDDAEDNPRTELARVIFVIDEMNRLYGERRTQESTQEGTLLSMWSNENVGVLRKHEKDTLTVNEWTYRVCFLVGAQAKWVHRLASETSAGLAQRWLYLPAVTTHVERPRLGRKRNTTAVELPTIDVPAEVWDATKPVAIHDHVQDLMELQAYYLRAADAAGRPVDPFKVHRAYNQARVAAALSVITRGRLEVSPEAWHLAAAVMDVSDLTRERIVREQREAAKRAELEDATARQLQRDAAEDAAHDQTVAKVAERLEANLSVSWQPFSSLRDVLNSREKKKGSTIYEDAMFKLRDANVLELRKNPNGRGVQYRRTPTK